ncbi:MAG: hypothetical protein AAF358_02935 [Pseudomonadota bacterium]
MAFYDSWRIFWIGAKAVLGRSSDFPRSRENGQQIISHLLEMERTEVNDLLDAFSVEHRSTSSNSEMRIASNEILNSLGEEIEEITEDDTLSEKQQLDAYSVGIGSLKDLLGELAPWLKNTLTLLKEIFDLLGTKRS